MSLNTTAEYKKIEVSPISSAMLDDLGITLGRRDMSSQSFAVWVRKLLQNWRQGTVGIKGRSEVTLSGKKPWKQKGTGKARAGTARSPLWRGGGVIHGPQPRSRSLKVPKKIKSGVLNTLFWSFIDSGNIYKVEKFNLENPSTRKAFDMLKELGVSKKKVALFLPAADQVKIASFVNLPQVNILQFDEVNAYDIASSDCWVIFKEHLDDFKKMVEKWI